jgi:hypothetical protein
VCVTSTSIGLATEAFSPGKIGENENNVSLIAEEPIGLPLTAQAVKDKLRHLPYPKSLYFDCVELAGMLLAKGRSALLSDDARRTVLFK